jgi:hypothetical protein
MKQSETPHIDSLPPVSADALPRTLPPKPRSRRRLWIISATILQGTGLFAGSLTYWLLFDPVLGSYRLFGGLLVGCTFLTCAGSLIANILLYREVMKRRR